MTNEWTPEAIRALGATTDLPTLGAIFGFGRWASYQMAHTGEWEQAGIHIIKIGARYRVTVQSVLGVLGDGKAPGTDVPPGNSPGIRIVPTSPASPPPTRQQASEGKG